VVLSRGQVFGRWWTKLLVAGQTVWGFPVWSAGLGNAGSGQQRSVKPERASSRLGWWLKEERLKEETAKLMVGAAPAVWAGGQRNARKGQAERAAR
jgi:hypothetical protein